MENKQFPSNKKLLSIQEEKLNRDFEYDSTAGVSGASCLPKKQLLLEILQKGAGFRKSSQKLLVSIKPRAPPIKTLFLAEKSRFHCKRSSDKLGSRLAIGDHSSFITHFSEKNTNIGNPTVRIARQHKPHPASDSNTEKNSSSSFQIKNPSSSICLFKDNPPFRNVCKSTQTQKDIKKCNEHDRFYVTMKNSQVVSNTLKEKISPKKVDIATLVVTKTPSRETFPSFSGAMNKLHRRIDDLERKVLRQEMVFRSIDHNIQLSSSDEVEENVMKSTSGIGRPGCSYIEQYSHIPETSAFQRYSHQGSPDHQNKATPLEKEHNSEQYGRDFTTYDGITARGRRQSASVPCKRNDIPKMAAERVHKIRHKLNPVRDYRLMDTVHYLAQGEFAPRDDGIKLTPSREAVLSDIIWEDVCRTHWPNTRLGRRVAHSDRYTTRGELQRLIDNLLRERVAHVERRKRRHYRIVKLNNRQEHCRPVGKTGDIIVASHKNKSDSNRNLVINDHKTTSAVITDRHREEKSPRKSHRSYERVIIPGILPSTRLQEEDCSPGPSNATYSASNRGATNCFRTSINNDERKHVESSSHCNKIQEPTSSSSMSAYKATNRKPRLVVKKETARRKSASKEEPNLEHFIILPTLVVRTPSNMKRQKKFNELYHRILNVHMNEAQNESAIADNQPTSNQLPNKKDISFNINITLSDSEEK